MRQGAVDRVRPGLCITLCNSLGLTVDASTARKIAFFQSGPSTYDLKTQKPLDPAKSERLVQILQTGNFILWFRNLLATRLVDVQSVVNGHGCDKFRASDASPLFELLKAVEAGETSITLSGEYSNHVDLKDLTDYIKRSPGASRDAGERPLVKINAMIATNQLLWKERRNPGGRLTGYMLPTALNPTITGPREVRKPVVSATASTDSPHSAIAVTSEVGDAVVTPASSPTFANTATVSPLRSSVPAGIPRRPARKAVLPGSDLQPVGATPGGGPGVHSLPPSPN